MLSKLQYISQGISLQDHLINIQLVLEGGGDWIQLRCKNRTILELIPVAEKVKELCHYYGATFLVNDQVELAKLVDADGVHLGLEDMSISAAREVLGPHKIIGGTANTLKDIHNRVVDGADYIGLGPFRFTSTKEKLSPVLGIKGYQNIMDQMDKKQWRPPIYAIGGIDLEDMDDLIKTGIYGIAVSGSLTESENKNLLIKGFKQKLYHESPNRK
ncbi:MAG: thiamine phosphate synthase [Chitinophagaceae bacterium]